MSSKGPVTQSQPIPGKPTAGSSIPDASKPIAIVHGYKASTSKPIAASAPTPMWMPGQAPSLSGGIDNDGIDLFGTSPAQTNRPKNNGL